jgi:hypothetical protein
MLMFIEMPQPKEFTYNVPFSSALEVITLLNDLAYKEAHSPLTARFTSMC